MAVRHYTSLDSGAPTLPGLSAQRAIDNLRLILMAALVNGYGAQPAAGWAVGHEHADGFSLSNGEGFINFVADGSNRVKIYLMEAITNGSAALAEGYNRRSGPWTDGANVTTRQDLFMFRFDGTFLNKQWCVTADAHTAVLQWSTSSGLVDAGGTDSGALYFGRYRPAMGGHGFCALGGNDGSNASYPAFAKPTLTPGTVLRHPMSGVAEQGASPGYRVGAACEINAIVLRATPVVSPGLLRPVRASVMGAGLGISGSATPLDATSCGVLRGLVAEPGLSAIQLSRVLQAIGLSAPVLADRVRPLALPGGLRWVPCYIHGADLGLFVSLDEADW